MKKRSILISLLTLAALISCGGGENPSNNEIPMSHGPISEVNESNFPSEDIKAFFNTDKEPVTFGGEEFYHEGVNEEGNKCYLVYCEKNEEASNDYFATYLPTIGYEISKESDYYLAISNSNPYMLLYYESLQNEVTYFIVQYYFDETFVEDDKTSEDDPIISEDVPVSSEDDHLSSENISTGGENVDTEYDEDFVLAYSFPNNIIKEFFNTSSTLVSYQAEEYYYARTYDEEGYDMFYIYSEKSSTACNSAYKTALENASYVVEEYEDDYGPYFYAYNENTGFEVIFFEDDEYGTFDLQVYYYGTGSSGDSGNTSENVSSEDNNSNEGATLSQPIVITSTHWTQSGYVEKEFTVNGFTFYSERVMLSTNVDYKDAMQFSRSSKGSGTIYNIDAINGAITIEIDLNFSSDFNMKVYVSNSSNGQFVAADMTSSGSIYSYDVEGYSFFKIVNESDKACYIDTITIK